MTDTTRLMSIGEFSSLTRISVRMLRHYDSHGVLIPAVVDEVSGYRRYLPEQTADAARIRRLRDVGFGVSAIGALLATAGTPAYTQALRLQRRVLEEELELGRMRLRALDRMLDEIPEDTIMTRIELTEIPQETYVCLRGTVADYSAEGELWQRFMPALQKQGIVPTGPGGCIEHDGEFRESDVDESVFLPVAPGTTAREPLTVHEFPARRAVVATVTGPYAESIPRAHEAIAELLAEHGLSAARVDDDVATHHFNVYTNDPSVTSEADLETAVYLPVR